MCHILGKIGPIYGTKNAHGKIHGLKKRILEYILSRYFIVTKYLQDEYRIYKNCIFSRLFKKFWWEKYGANYGQNLPNLCAIFCPWCFYTQSFWKISIHTPIRGVTMDDKTIQTVQFQFTLLCRSDYKISTKNHTFAWLFFLPCITILAHKRAFFNRNFLYYNKKQNQSGEQDCKRCNYRHIDRESFCND